MSSGNREQHLRLSAKRRTLLPTGNRVRLWSALIAILGTGCDLFAPLPENRPGVAPTGTEGSGGASGTNTGGEDAGDAAVGGELDEDASTSEESGGTTGTDPGSGLAACGVDVGDELTLPVSSENAAEIAVAAGPLGFGTLYLTDAGCEAIMGASVTSETAVHAGESLDLEGTCHALTDLGLLRVEDTWLAAWVDNRSGHADLHVRSYAANLVTPLSETQALTADATLERLPTVAALDAPTVFFVAEGEQASSLVALDIDGSAPVTVVDSLPARAVTQLAVTQTGEASAALAWVREGEEGGVYLQSVTMAGAPSGAPAALSHLAGASATVDLARLTRGTDSQRGGAAIYTVSPDGRAFSIRFQRLTEEGEPRDDERILLGSPLRGRDASVTAVGDGYAVAYRALPDGNIIEAPQIRLMFLTREGNVATDAQGHPLTQFVADASTMASRLTLRLSADGQLLLAFLDRDSDTGGTVLRLLRRDLNCP